MPHDPKSYAPGALVHPALIPALERVCAFARTGGVSVRPYSNDALETFREFTPLKQDTILTGLRTYEEILARNPKQATEREMVASALAQFGLKLGDGDFFSVVDDDDVIEIYTPQGLLLFRNFTAYKYTSYTLLDLLVYEWFELYERDQHLIDEMLRHTKEIMLNGTRAEKFKTPPHLLRERHLNCRKVISGEMKYICPLQDQNTGRNAAVMVTGKIHEVLIGDAADKIGWINTKRPAKS